MGVLDFGQAARKGIQAAATPAAQDVAATAVTPSPPASPAPPAVAAQPPVALPAIPSEPDPVESPPVEPTPEPEPEPVAVEGDLDELNKRADALESEIRDISNQIRSGQSRTAVTTGATIAERMQAEQKRELSDESKGAKLAERRKELVSVLTAIEALEGVTPLSEDPVIRPPGPDVRPEFDEKREPVFPGRDTQRADEKLREAESRIYTSEQMGDLPYEYFRSGPEKGETVIDVVDPSSLDREKKGSLVTPRRYAVSRKREKLKQLLGLESSPTQGIVRSTVNEGPLWPLHTGLKVGYGVTDRLGTMAGDVLTGGVIRKVVGGEPMALEDPLGATMAPGMYEEGALLPKAVLPGLEPDPHQGGVMFAPRGKVDPATLKTALLTNRRKIRGVDYQLGLLQDQLGQADNPKDIYASIEVLKDDKEQLEAVRKQLMRVQRVTLPRQKAEEDASERAESLSDEFAGRF